MSGDSTGGQSGKRFLVSVPCSDTLLLSSVYLVDNMWEFVEFLLLDERYVGLAVTRNRVGSLLDVIQFHNTSEVNEP